jgi:hypothetical protein
MDFKFTLFNSVTLFVMALTLWTAYARFRFRLMSNWFALYYLVILGFWLGFEGSLNTWWILAGIAGALVLRSGRARGPLCRSARILELAFFAYVLWRSVGLLLLL